MFAYRQFLEQKNLTTTYRDFYFLHDFDLYENNVESHFHSLLLKVKMNENTDLRKF